MRNNYDFADMPTDDAGIMDKITLVETNLDVALIDGTNLIRSTKNGTTTLDGFFAGTLITRSESYTQTNGTFNGLSYSCTGSSEMFMTPASLPYFTSGSYETCRATIDGKYYDITATADGSNLVTVDVSTTNETFYINLDTGMAE